MKKSDAVPHPAPQLATKIPSNVAPRVDGPAASIKPIVDGPAPSANVRERVVGPKVLNKPAEGMRNVGTGGGGQ